MELNKLLAACISSFLIMFVMSAIWYSIVIADFYKTHAPVNARGHDLFTFLVLGYLVQALIMAYIYPQVYEGGHPISEGLKFGMIMGLLCYLPYSLVDYGVNDVSLKLKLVESGWHVIEKGIGGIIIALIYGAETLVVHPKSENNY